MSATPPKGQGRPLSKEEVEKWVDESLERFMNDTHEKRFREAKRTKDTMK